MNNFGRFVALTLRAMIPGCTIIASFSTGVCSASMIYGTSHTGNLYSIDAATGLATLVTPTRTGLPGFGISELDGKLYVASFEPTAPPGGSSFGTLDPQTGAFSPIGNIVNQSWLGLTSDVADNQFYTVNNTFELTAVKPNGSLIPIGAITGDGSQEISLAYDNADHILYGLSYTRLLTRINTTNGSATVIGQTGLTDYSVVAGIAFDAATGTLYLNDVNPLASESSLYTVNTTTAAATLVGTNSPTSSLSIQTIAVVPEPSLPILSVTLAGALSIARRRNAEN